MPLTCQLLYRSLFLAAAVLIAACNNEASVPPIEIFGIPPANATLGVEYEYQVGVKGGDGLLEYSLSNAPPWLAVEYIDNEFYRGVLLRGIPGVSGKGELDLIGTAGEFDNVQINVTDGKAVGRRRFNLEVFPNKLDLESRELVEGDIDTRPQRLLDTNNTGQQDPGEVFENVPLCLLDDSGQPLLNDAELAFLETDLFRQLTERELDRRPALQYLELTLAQPSIFAVEGRYQLADSDYQDGFRPGVDSIGEIVIPAGITDVSQFNDASSLADLASNTSGLKRVRIDSGAFRFPEMTTLCHVLLMVADDTEAEETERVVYELTNVTGGLLENTLVTGRLQITDNEPITTFSVEKTSVPRNGSSIVVVQLDKLPEVDATVRFQVDTAGSTATFGPGGDMGVRLRQADLNDGTVLSDDLVLVENGFELRFNVRNTDTDPVLRTELQKRIEFFGQMPDTPSTAVADPVVRFSSTRTGTTNPPSSPQVFQAFINDFTSPYVANVGAGGRTTAFTATEFDEAFVGTVRLNGAGYAESEVVLLNRSGVVSESIVFSSPNLNVELTSIAYRSTGSLAAGSLFEELFTLLEVDGLFTGPLDRLGAESLGSGDLVVQKLRRINRTGGFRLVWQKQFGTPFEEVGGGLALERNAGVFVSGGTRGSINGFNGGGLDAYLARFSADGEQLFQLRRGGTADEVYTAAESISGTDVAVAGTIENSAASQATNVRDTLVASFSDDGAITRSNQFGTARNDSAFDISQVDRGYVVVGQSSGAVDLDIVKKDLSNDAFALYYPTLAAPETVIQLRTLEEDAALTSDALDAQTFFGGYTGGALFDGQPSGGGEDWWSVRYDILQNETINRRRFNKVWVRQRGSAGKERLVKLEALETAKLFEVVEYSAAGETMLSVAPIGVNYGNDLATCNAAINPTCPDQPVPPISGE